jgi:hypothetical protein
VSNNPSLAAITTVLSPDTVGTPKTPAKVGGPPAGFWSRVRTTNHDL